MNGDDFGQLIYLVLLGSVIAAYYLVSQRGNLGATARNAALWVFIFIGMIVVYGVWNDVRDTVLQTQQIEEGGERIELARQVDSHFYLTLDVGDVPVEFVVDTGATDVVLSLQDARRVGIDPETLIFSGRAQTANGEVRTARVRLEDVSLSGYDEGTLRASVNEGDLGTSLLGMSYLQRFDRIEISGNRLILER